MRYNAHKFPSRSRRQDGSILMLELVVAIIILLIAIFPIAFSFVHEARLFRAEYQHGVLMEIVDGEMEVLAAGEWKNFPDGSAVYPVHANAAKNLPPGHFQLTKTSNHLHLEWQPDHRRGTTVIAREAIGK